MSLYVYFISEFTEVLGLSCDSLAMLCKHIQGHGREVCQLAWVQGLAALHSFIFTWTVSSSKWCHPEQQISMCYFWVCCHWKLHVLFWFLNTVYCFLTAIVQILIFSTLLFHTGTISAQYGLVKFRKTRTLLLLYDYHRLFLAGHKASISPYCF